MSVTHQMIAARLGVSRAAVGFALRGDGHVSDETRRAVLDIARDMGYTPGTNRDARLLAARRNNTKVPTGIIAVVSAVGIEARFERISAYHGPLMVGIEMAALDYELALLVCSIATNRVPFVLRDGGVDGVISTESSAQVNEIIERHSLRSVMIGTDSPVGSKGDSIMPDETAGFTQVIDHLLELGHRQIGLINFGQELPNAVTRQNACINALRRHRLDPDVVLTTTRVYNLHDGAVSNALDEMLAICPDTTGIICYNDWVAMEAVRALAARGLSVPRDMSVVGFDDTSLDHGFTPALTTVRTPRIQIGSRAVELLVAQPHEPVTEYVPVEFIVRDSSGPPRR